MLARPAQPAFRLAWPIAKGWQSGAVYQGVLEVESEA
jgi:hypothetical protein